MITKNDEKITWFDNERHLKHAFNVVIFLSIVVLLFFSLFLSLCRVSIKVIFYGIGLSAIIIYPILLLKFYRTPTKIGVSPLKICLVYKKQKKEIPWDGIKKIVTRGMQKYPQLILFQEKKKTIRVDALSKETLNKILSYFHTSKQFQKEN